VARVAAGADLAAAIAAMLPRQAWAAVVRAPIVAEGALAGEVARVAQAVKVNDRFLGYQLFSKKGW